MLPRGAPGAVLALVGAAATAATVEACYGATGVRVELTTNVSCDSRPSTFIEATDQTSTSDCAARAAPNGNARVGDIVLLPKGSNDGPARVEIAMGLDGRSGESCLAAKGAVPRDCIVASRRFSFVPHEMTLLPIHLSDSCRGKTCLDPNTTCVEGGCVADDETQEARGQPVSAPGSDDGGSEAASPPDGSVPEVSAPDADVSKCLTASGGMVFPTPNAPLGGLLRHRAGRLYWVDTNAAGVSKPMSVRVDGTGRVTYDSAIPAAIDAKGGGVFVGAAGGVARFETNGSGKIPCNAVKNVLAIGAGSASSYVIASENGIQKWSGANVAGGCTDAGVLLGPTPAPARQVDLLDDGRVNALMAADPPSMRTLGGPDGGEDRVNVTAMFTDGVQTYYARSSGNAIQSTSIDGIEAGEAIGVTALAVSGDDIYWLSQPPGSPASNKIVRHDRALSPAGPNEQIGFDGVYAGLAADDACVYFWSSEANQAATGIRALPRK